MFDERAVELLESDVREMLAGIDGLRGKHRGVQYVRRYLVESETAVNVALKFYDDETEPDTEKREWALNRALTSFRESLFKAWKQFEPLVRKLQARGNAAPNN